MLVIQVSNLTVGTAVGGKVVESHLLIFRELYTFTRLV